MRRRGVIIFVGVILLVATHSTSTLGSNWHWVNPSPQGHDLLSIATGDEVLVAVGSSGAVLLSGDGVEWFSRSISTEYVLTDIAWGAGRFVAVGGRSYSEFSPGLGVVLTSSDGVEWVERFRHDWFTPGAVNWNGFQFTVVGNAGKVLVSTDGLTWAEFALDENEWEFFDLAWDGSSFLAIGQENYFTGGQAFFRSTDGISWQVAPADHSCYLYGVTWEDDLFVAVGGVWPGNPCVITSVNGDDWTETYFSTASGSFLSVIFFDGQFLAVGRSGVVATSPDGYSWAFVEEPTNKDVTGVTRHEDRYVAVGEGGLLMNSYDGVLWDQLSSHIEWIFDYDEIHEVSRGDRCFVAVGDFGRVITSIDGENWTPRQSSAPGDLYSVTWDGWSYWAAGSYGIVNSFDGTFWDIALFDPSIRLHGVGSGPGRVVAVGWNPSSSSRQTLVVSRSDSQNWEYFWLDAERALLDVQWIGNKYVAVGVNGLHFQSVDGETWTSHPFDEAITLRKLAWNGERLVAIGGESGIGPLVMTTTDGIDWERLTVPDGVTIDFDDIIWNGKRFIAVGNSDVVATSLDGLTWAMEPTGTGVLLITVGGDEGPIFAFGRGDQIIKRTRAYPYTEQPLRPSGRMLPVEFDESKNEPRVTSRIGSDE